MTIPISPIFLYKSFMNEIFFLLSAFLDLVYTRIITLVLNASKPFKNMFSNEVFCCYIFLSISKRHQVWSATDRKNLPSFWILRNKEQKVRKWNCCTHWVWMFHNYFGISNKFHSRAYIWLIDSTCFSVKTSLTSQRRYTE